MGMGSSSLAKPIIIFFSILLLIALSSTYANAATFTVRNNCPITVWAAAIPGGSRQMGNGETWTFDILAGTELGARVWPRTGYSFDGSGRGRCQTGDCNGRLECIEYGTPPNTIAEYSLNQFNNLDFFDISLVDGFNVPMEFSPNSEGCTRGIICVADINGQCPGQLRAPGGCNDPCTVFKTDEYCCNSGSCGPTDFSRFFKDRCPDAYSYSKDYPTSIRRSYGAPAAGPHTCNMCALTSHKTTKPPSTYCQNTELDTSVK